jgi:hypothetical protein
MPSGTCFAGWREGPVSNCLLSTLQSEIGDLLVRILISGTRKSQQGPNLESRAAMERWNSSWLTVTRFYFCAPVGRRGKKFAETWRMFSLSVKIRWYEQYIEGMGQSQNTAVLWLNGLRLLIYWFDNMFLPLQLGYHQVYKMFHTCCSFQLLFCNVHLSL